MAPFSLRIVDAADTRAVDRLITPRRRTTSAVGERAAAIVASVRRSGDKAVRRHARRLDGLTEPLEVTHDEMRAAATQIDRTTARAIRRAARHIRRVAERQRPRGWTMAPVPHVTIEQRVTPFDAVGCYVPGGRYPLPSSLLMTAIPAHVAGVPTIVAICPRPAPVVLAAAIVAGVTRFFRVGGAHGIAALAYGTDTIPRVEKIVGPGNAYVAAAKELVSSDCPIDFRAGPSEIVIVSRDGNPRWIAADLIAQAEHDPLARAILLTPNRQLARHTAGRVAEDLPSGGPARDALRHHGGIVVTRDIDEAVRLANRLAPEHLVCDDDETVRRITRCGTAFVGPFSAQAAGDYATGSNHVLPTAGAARTRGGLSASDFVHVSTVQRLTREGLRGLAPTAIALAEAEGLTGHARSIDVRLP